MIGSILFAAATFAGQTGATIEQDDFPDTPANYWAAKAVLDLRRWGLIDGYPSEKFGGDG